MTKAPLYFSLILAAILGPIIWQFYFDTTPDIYPIDLWSIPHFVIFFFLALLIYSRTRNKSFSLFVCINISIVYEVVEYSIGIFVPSLTVLSSEVLANAVGDIAFNILGAMIALLTVSNDIKRRKTFKMKH